MLTTIMKMNVVLWKVPSKLQVFYSSSGRIWNNDAENTLEDFKSI